MADTLESIRSPLSGEDDVEMTSASAHRRHHSAGTLDMPSDRDTKNKQDQQAQQQVGNADPPRIVDGLFEQKKFKPEQLSGPQRDKRVLEIIEQQFNLEILLKHNQLVEIEEEIGKCEAQMIALRHQYHVDPSVKLPNEPTEFTEKYLKILQKTDGLYNRHNSINWNNSYLEPSMQNQLSQQQFGAQQAQFGPNSSYDTSHSETLYSRTRSHTSSLRPSSGRYSSSDCIYRRTDGVFVKLTCPHCGRCNFSSAQGFLNHCRLAHQREFTSQDNAALTCGEVLHDEDQDAEGARVIAELKKKGLDPNKNLSRPEVPFLTQMLAADPPSSAPAAPTNTAESSTAPDDSRKRSGKISAAGLGFKTPRSTTKLKLKLQNLGKESDFDELVKDVTTEVETPHLFDDEEEEQQAQDAEAIAKEKRPSISARGAVNASRSSSSRNKARSRRKSRGGFSLVNEADQDMKNEPEDDEPMT